MAILKTAFGWPLVQTMIILDATKKNDKDLLL
jgi:hypothetical protein